jgi:hypothetical protein
MTEVSIAAFCLAKRTAQRRSPSRYATRSVEGHAFLAFCTTARSRRAGLAGSVSLSLLVWKLESIGKDLSRSARCRTPLRIIHAILSTGREMSERFYPGPLRLLRPAQCDTLVP